jgi:arylsulfatase A-like enzyme
LLLLSLPQYAQSQVTKPNFIVILADDLGYGDLGVYGAEKIDTPNLDQMAVEGVRFTSFYSNSTICTPTRTAFLTGRYSSRVGLDFIIPLTGAGSDQGLPAGELTLPEVLKDAGYTTAIVGKWHLGHQDQYNPTLHGFDTWFGVPYSNSYNDGDIPLYRDTQIIENPVDQTYLTQRYTEEALAFIEENAANPFLLYLPHTFPHIPLHASPDFQGTSEGGLYGDVVEEIDWSVGQILAKLASLGIDENTLVVFTSDNGPWTFQGDSGGSPGPFFCGKGSFFEGGVRVPFIAWWPGTIEPGRVVGDLAATFDLFPTIANLAGASLPAGTVIDAQDIRGLLLGTGQRADDELVFTLDQIARGVRAEEWKLLLEYPGGPGWMDECGSEPHPLLLYNIQDDPGETTNLAAQYPGVVDYLEGEVSAFQESLAQPDNQPPVANFVSFPTGEDGLTLLFEADPSFDADGNLVSYEWNFGDGAFGTGVQVTHTYAAYGRYVVTLRVEDDGGLSDGKLATLRLGNYFLPLIVSNPGAQ